MWIGLFSESEESDLDSIQAWTGDPIWVAKRLFDALEMYDWANEIRAELMACALDENEAHWDVFSPEGDDRIRVSFRPATTQTYREGT